MANDDKEDVPASSDEDVISALLAAAVESNSRSEEISAEDAEWADSCLVSGPQMSDDRWDAVKEALLETIAAQAESCREQTFSAELMDDDGEEEVGDGDRFARVEELVDDPRLLTEDDVRAGEDNLETLFDSQQDIESRDDIFKVWELEGDEEDDENELLKQLKKALTLSNYKGSLQYDEAVDVDELVAGMEDLSLKPPSESIQKGDDSSLI